MIKWANLVIPGSYQLALIISIRVKRRMVTPKGGRSTKIIKITRRRASKKVRD